eukprot:CAMPEP_0204372106 /NCGR_PEP_ID=MMETSP0469-20131031/47020_1 /ASSEMBLY_ACC=CAM_ASM_000384 /TAXON_ID=2969 /ORGANISM="Oxyrrhis marina" /LENGTH=46 /DNA_ID= /DNA_START= /DNA_END= /DNA_ORIENTATION=
MCFSACLEFVAAAQVYARLALACAACDRTVSSGIGQGSVQGFALTL